MPSAQNSTVPPKVELQAVRTVALTHKLDAVVAELDGSRALVLQAVVRLVWRPFCGDDKIIVREGGILGCDVQVAVNGRSSLRAAVEIVREAMPANSLSKRYDGEVQLLVVDEKMETLTCTIRGERIALRLSSWNDPGRYDLDTRLNAFVTLLNAALDAPDMRAEKLRLMDSDAAVARLAGADGPRCSALAFGTLDGIVTARATLMPDAVAIVDDEGQTTYGELCERAAIFAGALRDNNIRAGNRVGLCADVSANFVSMVMAIWSVGSVYVPLDPMVPAERLEMIVQEATVDFAVIGRAYAGMVTGCAIAYLDDLLRSGSRVRESSARSTDVAYILFTSGSTGKPKGVAITHRAASNAILSASEISGFGPHDRTLYRTPISFDLSIYDIFCSLASGASLVIASGKSVGDPHAIIEMIVEHQITHLLLGPALLAAILDRRSFGRCDSLRVVTCGGEALPWTLCERFFAYSNAELYNLYGPTEAAMLVTLHRCLPADSESGEVTAFLGDPLPNTHVSVRDEAQWPVPPGTIGEITIGGIQLARGYIGLPEETAQRFVPDPARPGELLYRTGDLARARDDGALVFLGRNDKQVKIRGHRVEPAEIVAAIERMGEVQTAVVCAHARATKPNVDEKVLAAYVKLRAHTTLTAERIRSRLQTSLPAYLLPSQIVLVEAFPLTVSGKIDEAALAAGSFYATASPLTETVSFSALDGILREELRGMWQDLLGHQDIGDHDNFSDIGGDSLLALRLMLQLEETFAQHVSLSDFFSDMTIAGLASLLSADAISNDRDAHSFNVDGTSTPFVYLHGDFAGGRYAWSLAKMLGAAQPITIVSPHGLRPGREATSVPLMAADVVETITHLYPTGPLRIGGFSAAGLVAYEVARLLTSAGRTVENVMLVASTAETARFLPIEQCLARVPQRLREPLMRTIIAGSLSMERFVRMPMRQRFVRVAALIRSCVRQSEARNEIEQSVAYASYVNAHATYIPRSYAGDVTVFWPVEDAVQNGNLLADWQSIAPHTEVVRVSGNHLGSVARHLDEIAVAMMERFA